MEIFIVFLILGWMISVGILLFCYFHPHRNEPFMRHELNNILTKAWIGLFGFSCILYGLH